MSTEFNTFFGGTYINCVYTTDDRSVISAQFKNAEDEVFEYHIIANSDEAAYVELLKIVSVEVIEQNTRDRIDEDRTVLLELAKQEAISQGYVMTSEIEELILNKVINFDSETDVEFLFKFKLRCFEMDIVANCTDEDLRIALRNTESVFDALSIVMQIKTLTPETPVV